MIQRVYCDGCQSEKKPDCMHNSQLWSYLRQREGDQPLPTPGGVEVIALVIEDLKSRQVVGLRRYGQPLLTFDNRDSLREAYEEQLDRLNYTKKLMLEVDAKKCDNEGCTPCLACSIKLTKVKEE